MMIQYFLMLIVLLLISGLAIDTGMLQWQQLSMQNAADAAAIEGMYQHARGDTNWVAEAQAQAAANGYANGNNNVTVTLASPPSSGSYSSDPLSVQATVVQQNITNVFMGLVNGGKSTVAATAVAKEIPTCIWIMDSGGSSSYGQLSVASGSLNTFNNCGVYVNTQAPSGNLQVDGFSNIHGFRIRLVGAAAQNLSTGLVNPIPRYSSAIKLDPLAYVTAPVVSSCNQTALSLSGVTMTATPGTYCGGTTITNSNVTLSAGLYIFVDGLTISNSSTISGTGVTIYLTKSSGQSSYTNVTVQNSTISLQAPTNSSSGGIPGVLIFADRNWVTHGSQGLKFNGSTITFDGYWYTLNTGLYLWQTNVSYYSYNGYIVDNLYQYSSSSHFGHSNFAALGGVSPLHYEDGVLVQ